VEEIGTERMDWIYMA